MSLDELTDTIESIYAEIDETIVTELDRETHTELAMLSAILKPKDRDELVRRAIRLLFQMTVETGQLDAQLRKHYNVTYDEYLMGMTYDDMTGGHVNYPKQSESDRRYQF